MADQKVKIAVFGGGCFWCTEAVFSAGGGSAFGGKMINGIISVTPGYAGGSKPNPTYEEISVGKTGHAEVIKIEYDPEQIAFRDLLTVFFATHDPTTLNRQGNDIGEQYRSIILYTGDEQKLETEKFIKELNASSPSGKPIVTEIKPLDKFYEAESYHKDYYAKNQDKPYCQIVINPKLEKIQKEFAKLIKINNNN